jgi:uncharacterized membrane protein YedE/YeeE
MTAYWPFWLGALGLAGVGLTFWKLFGKPLGVSSSWTRLVQAPEESAIAREEAKVFADPKALEAALLAATAAEFGTPAPGPSGAASLSLAAAPALPERLPWPAHVTFLLALIGGGCIAALTRGDFAIRFTPGADFERFFGSGYLGWAIVLLGGFLSGFGTRMAGGCTSGHGLMGVSRLQKGSLLATASFFGAGVAASFFIWKVL